MIPNNHKTYLNILNNIPQYIKDEDSYVNFINFLQAYYEWLSEKDNIEDKINNLQYYMDIDETIEEFEKYFFNQFLQYFPEETLVDKRKLVKFSKELYQRKSTPASFKFLFRALYNSDCEVFEAKDYILKASDGKWATSKTVQIKTIDSRFLKVRNYLIIGEISKAVGRIEKSKITGTKIEIFLSDINRDFTSGEFIRIVDSNFQDVIIDGSNLRAKISGSVKTILVNPNFTGLNYLPGDPVIIHNGLNPDVENPIGALAEVESVAEGGLGNILVLDGSQGFRLHPYSDVEITGGGGGFGASAQVIGVDYTDPFLTTGVSMDTVYKYRNIHLNDSAYGFSNNMVANANTRLINALTTPTFTTYPLKTISVVNKGSRYIRVPDINVVSNYATDIQTKANLAALKILGPISVVSNGSNYSVNDTIIFSGGTGAGAFANVTSVDGSGGIVSVDYVSNYTNNGQIYPIGGLGYNVLPTLSVKSLTGSDAELRVNHVLGDGEIATAATDSIGQVKSIKIIEPGEDYITTPAVSLRIMDIAVANVSLLEIPSQGSKIYQGTANSSTYKAILYSVNPISAPENKFVLRVYDYSGVIKNEPLYIDKDTINDQYFSYTILTDYIFGRYNNGIIYYGNGSARANAKLLTGTTAYDGKYLNADGHLSAYCKLESEVYNNFTYFLDVNIEFNKYKEILYNVLNPAGVKVIGKNIILNNDKFNNEYNPFVYTKKQNIKTLFGSNANGVMVLSDSIGSNIIQLYGVSANTLASYIDPDVDEVKLTIINNSQSVSQMNILVNSMLIPEFPPIGNTIYQGSSTSPTFYGSLYDYGLVSENLYEIVLKDYHGTIDTSKGAQIYCDKSTNNDKYYTFNIYLDSYYPYMKGITSYNNREIFYSTITKVVNTSIELESYNIIKFDGVANGYSYNDSIILTDINNKFNLINNGKYSSSEKLRDMVFVGDLINTSNNTDLVVTEVDYSNNVIYFASGTVNSDGDETSPVEINITRNFNSDEIYIEF